MTVFSNLLRLYRKNGASATPEEDFCTECLAGILRSDSNLLKDFIQDILKIDSDSRFKVTTQRTFYTKEEGEQGRLDLVLESQEELCFVEIKVRSGEGPDQLKKYSQILREQNDTITTYLRYCTLYIEEKEPLENFEQFRWADIAKFLAKRTKHDKLIHEFYNFLKENNMAGNERFSHEDLVGLKVYGEIAQKVNEVFNLIKPKLENFGIVSGGLNASSHIMGHNRLALLCKGVLQDSNSEVLVSFDFIGMKFDDEPVVSVQLFVHRKNSFYQNFVEIAKMQYQNEKYKSKDILSTNEYGAHIRYEKPLALFFSEEEQLQMISKWIEERLDEIMKFRNNHPELDWKFPKEKI